MGQVGIEPTVFLMSRFYGPLLSPTERTDPYGGTGWIRTNDTLGFNQVLYQLSYSSMWRRAQNSNLIPEWYDPLSGRSPGLLGSLSIFVFCCRKRYSPESLAAQWIQGFAQLVFLFFCAFFKPFPNPHIDILTKPCANRIRKKGHASAQPSFLLQSYDLLI